MTFSPRPGRLGVGPVMDGKRGLEAAQAFRVDVEVHELVDHADKAQAE